MHLHPVHHEPPPYWAYLAERRRLHPALAPERRAVDAVLRDAVRPPCRCDTDGPMGSVGYGLPRIGDVTAGPAGDDRSARTPLAMARPSQGVVLDVLA